MTTSYLVPLVVLIPLLGAAAALIAGRRPRLQAVVSIVALALVVVISLVLLVVVDTQGAIAVQVGGWQAPFGITLVVDRLAALMLSISSIVLLAVFVFSVGQGQADGDGEARRQHPGRDVPEGARSRSGHDRDPASRFVAWCMC